jgi:hypothetical protein
VNLQRRKQRLLSCCPSSEGSSLSSFSYSFNENFKRHRSYDSDF